MGNSIPRAGFESTLIVILRHKEANNYTSQKLWYNPIHTQLLHIGMFIWFLFIYYQHARSCQKRYKLVTVCIHGDYSGVPLGDQATSIMTQYPRHSHYSDTVLTRPCHVLLMPNAGLNNETYQLYKLSVALGFYSVSRHSIQEASARLTLPPRLELLGVRVCILSQFECGNTCITLMKHV